MGSHDLKSFNGIDENGVRFPGFVDIPEGAKLTVAVIDASPPQPPLSCNSPKLYALLGERFHSGDPSAAARHNEHQP
jgi:hypothetical protein